MKARNATSRAYREIVWVPRSDLHDGPNPLFDVKLVGARVECLIVARAREGVGNVFRVDTGALGTSCSPTGVGLNEGDRRKSLDGFGARHGASEGLDLFLLLMAEADRPG